MKKPLTKAFRLAQMPSFESENKGGKTRTENKTHPDLYKHIQSGEKSKNLFQIAHQTAVAAVLDESGVRIYKNDCGCNKQYMKYRSEQRPWCFNAFLLCPSKKQNVFLGTN